MRLTLTTMGLAGVLAVGAFAIFQTAVHAGCGGGGGYSRGGGYGGGHTFGAASYGGYAGGGRCGGMAMGGMNMGAMTGNGMAGMNMAGAPTQGYPAPTATYVPPAAVAASYTCPMHPSVVSSTPGTCPYCRLALTRR